MKPKAKIMTQAAVFFAVMTGLTITGGSASAAELKAGTVAPDFTFTVAPGGGKQTLSDYRGKPVALHFWTSWCGPCIRELPLISEFSAANTGSIAVLAVNCGEPEKIVNSFVSKLKLSLNVIMDGDGSISRLYSINAIPQTWLIDENGVIRSIRVGAYNKRALDRDFAALLKNSQQ